MPIRIVAPAYGTPEVLELQQYDAPALEPGQVRVEVHAAAVNPYDVKSYNGIYGTDPSKLPVILGQEAAGVVIEIGGDSATGPTGNINVGDEVIVHPVKGAYSDEVVAAATSVLARPAELTVEQASGLMLTGVTAIATLVDTGVKAGKTVLIHGGAGGVGLTAVQLAVAQGVNVIATASPRQHELLQELGAQPVAYGDGLLERVREIAVEGVDAAIDLVGSDEALNVSLALVSDRNRIATIANFSSRAKDEGVHILGGTTPEEKEIRSIARLQLIEAVKAGRLKVFVEDVLPLQDAAKAHELISAGHTHGKIVLTPQR